MNAASGPGDVLEVGDPNAAARPLRTVAVLLVAVLVVLTGWWFDRGLRRDEFTALTGCVQTGQSALAGASAKIWQISEYVRPALAPDTMPALSAGLMVLVASTAEETLPALHRSRSGCAEVGLRYWHRDLGSARGAYLAYLDARIAVIEATADAGSVAFTQHPELDGLRARARDRLVDVAIDRPAADRADRLLRP